MTETSKRVAGSNAAAGAGLPAAVSAPARIADPGEQISVEELQLAARNHGLPLEALACDITPPGLHYLLTHYDMPILDESTWRLRIDGTVESPLNIDLSELRAMPQRTLTVTFECAGNGRARYEPRAQSQPWLVEAVGTATWTGVPLARLLEKAGVRDGALDVVCTGADHGVERGVEQDYQRALDLADALDEDVLVAYEMNGSPLPLQHGFPARLVVPGWYGMAQVKWLTGIEVLAERFDGFQHRAYRLRHWAEGADGGAEPDGVALTRIEPRALLIPPGYPDFYSRTRVVAPGEVEVSGRAWSGWAPVTRVQLTTDGGSTWIDAELDPEPGELAGSERYAWRRWRATWLAGPGEYHLGARAQDASGRVQAVEAPWNRGGFANNSVQRVRVVCQDR
ncbi:MAG: sulfite oxidase [Actinomycetota bacterium]|nr:sulfite oxidase [Actinomycetota bacterium]